MKHKYRVLSLVTAAACLLLSPAAGASGYVFLNGVPVTGMKNQKFEGCTVVFDASGNVQISAPGIKIKAVPQAGAARAPQPPPPAQPTVRAPVAPPRPAVIAPPTPTQPVTMTPSAPPPRPVVKPKPKPAPKPEPPEPVRTGPLTQRYFLVAIPTTKGVAQYDVDVYINKRHAKKVRNRVHQLTFEVTKWLKWGPNEVQFAATKNLDGKQRISSSAADFMRIVIGPGVKGGGTVKLDEILADFRAPASKMGNFGNTQTIKLK